MPGEVFEYKTTVLGSADGKSAGINLDEAQGIVECFVAGIGNKDSVGDIVASGAFTKSLMRRKPRVVWGHNWNDPIGKVLEIYEVPTTDRRLPLKMKVAGIGGLFARVQFNLNSEKGREAFANVAFFGEEQEWSIGYKTLRAQYDQKSQANVIYELELYEVSPVLHGANQLTGTISVKSDSRGGGMMAPMMEMEMGMPDQDEVDREELQKQLSMMLGTKVSIMDVDDEEIVYARRENDGKVGRYKCHYSRGGGGFMFGTPQRIVVAPKPAPIPMPMPMAMPMAPMAGPGMPTEPQRIVRPSQMPGIPVAIKPGENGMQMVPLPPVEYENSEKPSKRPEFDPNNLDAEEADLRDALLKIVKRYGKFNEDSEGVWAGYKPASENPVKDIGVKCANCVFFKGGDTCQIIDMPIESEGKCRFAVIPKGVVSADVVTKKSYEYATEANEELYLEELEAKYPGELVIAGLRGVLGRRKKGRRKFKSLADFGRDDDLYDSAYCLNVMPQYAFRVKQALDPIFDYYGVETFVDPEGIVISSGVSFELIEAVDTALTNLKKKIEIEDGLDEKALGYRIGRAIGSRMIDRPNLGGGRSRGRFFTSPGAEDFNPFTARDAELDGMVGEGLFIRGVSLAQPDPTPDGPGSIRNPKPSSEQLKKPIAEPRAAAQKISGTLSSGKLYDVPRIDDPDTSLAKKMTMAEEQRQELSDLIPELDDPADIKRVQKAITELDRYVGDIEKRVQKAAAKKPAKKKPTAKPDKNRRDSLSSGAMRAAPAPREYEDRRKPVAAAPAAPPGAPPKPPRDGGDNNKKRPLTAAEQADKIRSSRKASKPAEISKDYKDYLSLPPRERSKEDIRKYDGFFTEFGDGQSLSSGKVDDGKTEVTVEEAQQERQSIDEMYAAMAEQVIQALEELANNPNATTWKKPWQTLAEAFPNNPTTKRAYAGGNVLILALTGAARGYKSSKWAGQKQWEKLGGRLKPNAQPVTILAPNKFATQIIDRDGNPIGSYRGFHATQVYNVADIDGLPEEMYVDDLTIRDGLSDEQRLADLEQAISEIGAKVIEKPGNDAYFSPSQDHIVMPAFAQYNEPINFYSTMLHEHVHWTGHPSRLDRKQVGFQTDPTSYAFEELIAEIGSAFALGLLGIEAPVREDHAQYLSHWMERLKTDPTALKRAIEQAQKAVDFLLNRSETMRRKAGWKETERRSFNVPEPGVPDVLPGEAPKVEPDDGKELRYSLSSGRPELYEKFAGLSGYTRRDKDGNYVDQTGSSLSSGAKRGPIQPKKEGISPIPRSDGSMRERYGFAVEPTEEQRDIIDAAVALARSGDPAGALLAVKAAAGSGKTTTLEWAARAIQQEMPDSQIFYLVFNRANAKEGRHRMPGNTGVSTISQLAYWGLRGGDGDARYGKGMRRKAAIAAQGDRSEFWPRNHRNWKAAVPVVQPDGSIKYIDGLKQAGARDMGYTIISERTGGKAISEKYGIQSAIGGQNTIHEGTTVSDRQLGNMLIAALRRFSISDDDKISKEHFKLSEEELKQNKRLRDQGKSIPVVATEWNDIPDSWLELAQKMWADIEDENSTVVPSEEQQVKLWALAKPDLRTSMGMVGHVDKKPLRTQDRSLPTGTVVNVEGERWVIAENPLKPESRYLLRRFGGEDDPLDTFFFDEAQDTNPVMQKVLADNIANGMKIVMVGDPRQSILGFRGSRNTFEALSPEYDLPLTASFRWGKTFAYLANIVLMEGNLIDREEGKDSLYKVVGKFQDVVRNDFNVDGLDGPELDAKLLKLEKKYGTKENPLKLVGLRGKELDDALSTARDELSLLAEGVLVKDMQDPDAIIAATNTGLVNEGLLLAINTGKRVGIIADRHQKWVEFLDHYAYVMFGGQFKPRESKLIGNFWTADEVTNRLNDPAGAEGRALVNLLRLTNPKTGQQITIGELREMLVGRRMPDGSVQGQLIRPIPEDQFIEPFKMVTGKDLIDRAARKAGKGGKGKAGDVVLGRSQTSYIIPVPEGKQTARVDVKWRLGLDKDGEWDGSVVVFGDGVLGVHPYTDQKGQPQLTKLGPTRQKVERFIAENKLEGKIVLKPLHIDRRAGSDLPAYDAFEIRGDSEEETAELLSKLGRFITDTVNEHDIDVELVTGHISKGREWDNVRIANDFGPEIDPQTGAIKRPDREKMNLLYVTLTRARRRLDPGSSTSWLFDEKQNPGIKGVEELLDEDLQRPRGFWYPYGNEPAPEGFDDSRRLSSGRILRETGITGGATARRAGAAQRTVGSRVAPDSPKNTKLRRIESRNVSAINSILSSGRMIGNVVPEGEPGPDSDANLGEELIFDEESFAELNKYISQLGKVSNRIWANNKLEDKNATAAERRVARNIINSGDSLSSGRAERRVIRSLDDVKRDMEYDWSTSGFGFTPTGEQQDISDAVMTGGDVIVRALAGTGKTTTLQLLAKRLLDQEPDKKLIYLVFNTKMREEAEVKFRDYPNVEVRTWDSVATKAVVGGSKKMDAKVNASSASGIIFTNSYTGIRDHYGLSTIRGVEDGGQDIEGYEQALIMSRTLDTFAIIPDREITAEMVANEAKQLGMTLTAKQASAIVKSSKQMWKDAFDENSPIQTKRSYMVKQWSFMDPDLSTGESMNKNITGNDILMFDEAQDANRVISSIVRNQKMQKVIVGDSNQAIYEFRGAVDELDKFGAPYEMTLTETFRFGAEIAEFANLFLSAHETKQSKSPGGVSKSAQMRIIGRGPSGQILDSIADLPEGYDRASNRPLIDGKPMTYAHLTQTNAAAFRRILDAQDNGLRTGSVSTFKDDLVAMVETAKWLKYGKKGKRPEKFYAPFAPYNTWRELELASDKTVTPNPREKVPPSNIQASTAYLLMKREGFNFRRLEEAISKIEVQDMRGDVLEKEINPVDIADGTSVSIIDNGIMVARIEGNEIALNYTVGGANAVFMARKPIFNGRLGFIYNSATRTWRKRFSSKEEAAQVLNDLSRMVREGLKADGGPSDFDSPEKIIKGINAGSMRGMFAEVGGPGIQLSFERSSDGKVRAYITGKTYNLLGKDNPIKTKFKSVRIWRWDAENQRYVAEANSAEEMAEKVSRTREAIGISGGGYIVEPAVTPKDDTGVDIVAQTAHRSKGLEYDVVVLDEDFRKPKEPEQMDEEEDWDPIDGISAEDIRLQYVAATRAKRTLVTGSLSWIYEAKNRDNLDSGTLSSGRKRGKDDEPIEMAMTLDEYREEMARREKRIAERANRAKEQKAKRENRIDRRVPIDRPSEYLRRNQNPQALAGLRLSADINPRSREMVIEDFTITEERRANLDGYLLALEERYGTEAKPLRLVGLRGEALRNALSDAMVEQVRVAERKAVAADRARRELGQAITLWDSVRRAGIALDIPSRETSKQARNATIRQAIDSVGSRMEKRPAVTVGNISNNANLENPSAATWMLPVDKLREAIRVPTEYSVQRNEAGEVIDVNWSESRALSNAELATLLNLGRADATRLSEPGAGISHDAVRYLLAEIARQPEFSGWRLFGNVSRNDPDMRDAEFPELFFENVGRANMRDRFIIETFGKDAFPHWYDEEIKASITPDQYEALGEESRVAQFRASGRFRADTPYDGDSEAEYVLAEEVSDAADEAQLQDDRTSREDFELKPLLDYLGLSEENWKSSLSETLRQALGDDSMSVMGRKTTWDKDGVPTAAISEMIRRGIIPNASSVWGDGRAGERLDSELNRKKYVVFEALYQFLQNSAIKRGVNTRKARSYILGDPNPAMTLSRAARDKGRRYVPNKTDEPRFSMKELQGIVNRFNEIFGTKHTIEDIFSEEQLRSARERIEEFGRTISFGTDG